MVSVCSKATFKHLSPCYYILALVVLFVFTHPFTGFAEEKKFTLTDAIRTALEGNYELRATKNAVLARKEGIGIARSAFLPKITFEERATRTNNPPLSFMMKLNQQRFSQNDFILDALNNPRPVNDYQTAFLLEQPLFSLKSYWGLSQAHGEHRAKNNEYNRKREEIIFRVIQAYLRLHTAGEYTQVSQKSIEDAREHLRIAEARYRNNIGLYSDSLRAHTALTEAEQSHVSSEKEYATAKRWFGLVLGLSEPVGIAEEELAIAINNLDYYTKNSLDRYDLAALKERHDSTKKQIKTAEAGYFPYIALGGSYQMNDHRKLFGSEGDSWQVSAFLRWELFDGMRREFERSKARYEAAEIKESINNLREFITFKVHDAYLAVEEAHKNLELAQTALKYAEEGARLVRSRYENSLSPVVDLLDAQLSLNRARANTVAQKNAYILAIVNLQYESGTIMKDLRID